MSKFLFFAGFVAALAVLAASVFAQPVLAFDPLKPACDQGGGGSSCTGATDDPIAGNNGALKNVINILSFVGGIVAVIFIVIGGIKYITANGNSGDIASAKSTIIYALIGAIVVVLARQIIAYVLTKI